MRFTIPKPPTCLVLFKGAEVDRLVARVMRRSNVDRSAAIAILKSKGVIKQDGKHLVMA